MFEANFSGHNKILWSTALEFPPVATGLAQHRYLRLKTFEIAVVYEHFYLNKVCRAPTSVVDSEVNTLYRDPAKFHDTLAKTSYLVKMLHYVKEIAFQLSPTRNASKLYDKSFSGLKHHIG